MSERTKVTDRRLLAALDYIDQKYIDDVFDLIKEPAPAQEKTARFKVWKQVIALAACLLLLSAAFPIVDYVVKNTDFFAGLGSGTALESSDMPETVETAAEATEPTYVRGAYLNPIKELEPLPQGLLEKIDSEDEFGFSSFSVLNRGITRSDRYLGYIGGYYVFFDTSEGVDEGYMTAQARGKLNVAGYDFYYNTPFSIILHKDGVNTNLKKAYESGEITLDDVRKIYCRNNEYLRYFDPELNFKDKVPVTEEEFNEVREVWISKYGESIFFAGSFEHTDNMDYYFYGHIGENIIFHAGNPEFDGKNEWVDFEIEGYPFTVFLKPVNIWVYRDGEIMLLQDAYNRGLVASEDLPTISYMNQLVLG